MRTPDYVLTEAHGELPAGAFVRPIKLTYLPKGWEGWVKGGNWFDAATETVCYTAKGLLIIPNKLFRIA